MFYWRYLSIEKVHFLNDIHKNLENVLKFLFQFLRWVLKMEQKGMNQRI